MPNLETLHALRAVFEAAIDYCAPTYLQLSIGKSSATLAFRMRDRNSVHSFLARRSDLLNYLHAPVYGPFKSVEHHLVNHKGEHHDPFHQLIAEGARSCTPSDLILIDYTIDWPFIWYLKNYLAPWWPTSLMEPIFTVELLVFTFTNGTRYDGLLWICNIKEEI